ncbi:MAG: putative toxin-antitoxin system toxin component, PIN family [Proteobacteria bacterium]|nr:putative toxin-antitoxin system toxin component, PIN family [Pseudomonadota bacterium]
MRIVLDTNILIAALITKDTPPDRLYQAWLRGEIEVITSTAQVAEIAAVLARPRLQKYLDADEAAAIVENIDTRAVILRDPPDVDLSPDPNDNPIFAAAIAGKADLIISGDKKHMLSLGEAAGIPIVTAREALHRLDASKNRSCEGLIEDCGR